MSRGLPGSVRSHLRWLLGQPGGPGLSSAQDDATLCALIRLLDCCAELTGDDAYLEGITTRLETLDRAAHWAGQGTSRAAAWLAALTSHARVAGEDLREQAAPAVETISAALERWYTGQAVHGWDPGLIKPAAVLLEAADWLGRADLAAVAGKLFEALPVRSVTSGESPETLVDTPGVVEARCEAVEGLVLARAYGRAIPEETLLEAAERLAALQAGSGGVATAPGTAADVAETATATARAVRIWQCVDEHCHGMEIRRGLSFLRRLAARGGGIRAAPGSDRIDAAATVYAVQALLWQRGRVDPAWLI